MNKDMLREKSIKLMSGFMKDVLYDGQEVSEEEALSNATLYFDLVEASIAEVEKEENNRLATAVTRDKEASDLKAQGIIDASDSFAVDMAGGPNAVDNSTIYRG
jgi:hypothetical protein